MIVYGSRKTKYILSKKPSSGDGECAVYPVSERPDILAKIYQKAMRTTEKEYQVMEAINGTGMMLGEYPLEIVYERGKFAGYIFEKEEPYFQQAEPAPNAILPIEPKKELSSAAVILLNIIAGLVLSGIMYLFLFPTLFTSISHENIFYYFRGIPMIIGGWAALILMLLKINNRGFLSVVISAISFIIGNIAVFCGIWLIITLVKTAAAIVWAILPTVLTIIIIVWIVKAIIR